MRKIKEVLRLKWQNACSNKQIAKSCNIARSTVREYLKRAQDAGLTWPLDPELDDTVLENLFFPVREAGNCPEPQMPSMEYLFRELKRKRREWGQVKNEDLTPLFFYVIEFRSNSLRRRSL